MDMFYVSSLTLKVAHYFDCRFAHLCSEKINGAACCHSYPCFKHVQCPGPVQADLNVELWLEELKGDPDEAFSLMV